MIPTLHRAFAARDDDILIGSRWARGGTSPGTNWFRSTGSRLGTRIFRVITGTRGIRDATTSFRVYSPRAVRFLLRTRSDRFEGYSFFSTSVALCEAAGLRMSEVPITFRPRYSGTSKFNRSEAIQVRPRTSGLHQFDAAASKTKEQIKHRGAAGPIHQIVNDVGVRGDQRGGDAGVV